jgi:hypothetical protein
MSVPLPAEIEVTELADGVRYTLPRRRLDRFHLLGHIFLIAFGLFFGGMPLFLTGVPAIRFMLAGGPGAWFHVLPLLHAAPFVLIGAAILAWGVLMLAGSCEIEIRDGAIRTSERAGPFHWTRSRPVECIRELEIRVHPKWSSIKRFMGKERITIGPPADFGVLRAECEGAKPLALVLTYPRSWLRAMADDLAERLTPVTSGTFSPVHKAAVEVTETFLVPPGFRGRSKQPGSNMLVGVVCAALGCLSAGVGVWFTVHSYRFASTALRAEGTVVRLVRSSNGTSAPVIRYQVSGQAFERQSRVSSRPPAYSVGDKVSVLYRPDQPGTGQIDSFMEQWFVPLLCGGLGTVFVAVGCAIIFARPRRRRAGRGRASAGSAN